MRACIFACVVFLLCTLVRDRVCVCVLYIILFIISFFLCMHDIYIYYIISFTSPDPSSIIFTSRNAWSSFVLPKIIIKKKTYFSIPFGEYVIIYTIYVVYYIEYIYYMYFSFRLYIYHHYMALNNNNLLLHPDFLPVFGTLPLFNNVVIGIF